MKTISLWQPWASLVVGGFKTYETRSWKTPYRGMLAIHATKNEPTWVHHMFNHMIETDLQRVVWEGLGRMGYEAWMQLPRGCVVGTVELRSILPVEMVRGFRIGWQSDEMLLGDYSDGRFAWQLMRPVRLPYHRMIVASGKQGLWECELDQFD